MKQEEQDLKISQAIRMSSYQPQLQQDHNPIEKLNIYEVEQELKFVRESL